MASNLSCCANFTRFLLVIINIVFFLIGIAVLGVGAWGVAQNNAFNFITGNRIIGGAAVLIIAGIVTIIISVIGILGSAFKWRPLLVIYSLVVLLIVILMVVAAILAFVFRDRLVEFVAERSVQAIRLYQTAPDAPGDPSATNAVNFIQATFMCCGFTNASDWEMNIHVVQNLPRPPGCPSCESGPMCATFTLNDTVSFNTTTRGCGNSSSGLINTTLIALGGVGIAFAVILLFGVLFGFLLCCCIGASKEPEVV